MSVGSKLKNFFSGGDEEEETIPEPEEDDTRGFLTDSVDSVKSKVTGIKLSWQQRIIGFIICAVIAAIFIVVGCAIAGASPPAFAVLFSIGTITAVVSTFFLMGPITQLKKLTNVKENTTEVIIKIVAIVTFILAVILAIVCAAVKQPILAILLAVIQVIALIVYAITLIPFAMSFIIRGCKSIFSTVSSG
ncbi:PREDICTED: vesicle transport protein SFT2B-like [Amphimedon queenslandica]|uniref:Vesicle transport protein n=1 Tax=Amphimedon queenslandica TaxID=400682 RepID=A0A1X7V0H6_AMPQE|nr:PREDICTED: vesicle transport protein SFT2B-like [Amphimedon queenslandica]|eukprot:XP_019851445.1 PREDICTED: vesicle transport protein SFT2B-like [Amphimedon queenslandica]